MTKIDARIGWAIAAALSLSVPVAAAASDAVSESDRFFLDEAASACASGDFPAFLWPFANSRPVRERYSAATILSGFHGSARPVDAASYLEADDFPVMMIDYSYVTGTSARTFHAPGGNPSDLVYVQIDFSERAGDVQRVDWAPGRFLPDEGDGPGTLIEKTGPGGSLTFGLAGGCWELIEDIRNPARPR